MKLYKRKESEIHYWETWDINSKKGAIHKGVLGKRGDYREVNSRFLSSFRKEIQKEIEAYCKDGYQEVDIEDHYALLIEYKINGHGNNEDLDKRTRLQNRMNETLG